jgi:hypothetical protein
MYSYLRLVAEAVEASEFTSKERYFGAALHYEFPGCMD